MDADLYEVLLVLRKLETSRLSQEEREQINKAVKLLVKKDKDTPVFNLCKEAIAKRGFVPPNSPMRMKFIVDHVKESLKQKIDLDEVITQACEAYSVPTFKGILLNKILPSTTGVTKEVLTAYIPSCHILDATFINQLQLVARNNPEIETYTQTILENGIKI